MIINTFSPIIQCLIPPKTCQQIGGLNIQNTGFFLDQREKLILEKEVAFGVKPGLWITPWLDGWSAEKESQIALFAYSLSLKINIGQLAWCTR